MSESTPQRQRSIVWQSRPDRPMARVSVGWFGKDGTTIPIDKVDTVSILRNGGLMEFDVTPGSGFAVKLMLEAVDTIMASEQIPGPFGGSSDE